MPDLFDLRGPSLDQKRFRTRAEKYYSFRAVKAGQLGRLHYNLHPTAPDHFWYVALISSETPTEICTKQRLYMEAQQWPRPPKYHHAHRDKVRTKRGKTLAYERRREEERERARVLQRPSGSRQAWKEHEEGGWHPRGARICGICGPELEEIDMENEAYESSVGDEDWDVQEMMIELGEQALAQLVADAVEAQRLKALCELGNDGWSLCSSDDLLSDEGSEFEIV